MKDSYGTYDGSRPEPPYQTTEDDRCDRIEYLEERLSAVCRRPADGAQWQDQTYPAGDEAQAALIAASTAGDAEGG
jgi:hypothetical protein